LQASSLQAQAEHRAHQRVTFRAHRQVTFRALPPEEWEHRDWVRWPDFLVSQDLPAAAPDFEPPEQAHSAAAAVAKPVDSARTKSAWLN
jgi:hypothetical protein